MPRKSTGAMPYSLRLDPTTIARLGKLEQDLEMSRSQVVRLLIRLAAEDVAFPTYLQLKRLGDGESFEREREHSRPRDGAD
jgi:hypothetical protein